MKTTYALIGIGFLIVIGAFIFLSDTAVAPVVDEGSTMVSDMKLTSSAFENGAVIPSKYTCDAENVSPPLSISGVPENAKSLVLVMDDPDVPKELRPDGVFDHWIMYSIDPATAEIPEGAGKGAEGLNGTGKTGYTGPCPPRDYEPSRHRYFFKLYALDSTLNFIKVPTKAEVLTAIESSTIAEAELMRRYKRVAP